MRKPMTIQQQIEALKKDFETKIAELEKQAKAEEKQRKVREPTYGDLIWMLDSDSICNHTWTAEVWETNAFKRGNILETQKEAVWADQHRVVAFELECFVKENDPRPITEGDWEDELLPKYYIRYDYHVKKCNTFKTVCVKFANQVYASSEEVLQKAIKHIGEERLKKYYFGVE